MIVYHITILSTFWYYSEVSEIVNIRDRVMTGLSVKITESANHSNARLLKKYGTLLFQTNKEYDILTDIVAHVLQALM